MRRNRIREEDWQVGSKTRSSEKITSARRAIEQVDSVIRRLDEVRDSAGPSKAELARRIGRDPSSIRRLFTARSNPELLLVASIAEDLDARRASRSAADR